MCPDASMYQATPCSAGYYQTGTSQTACIRCPAGYYCPLMAVGDYTAYACPAQYYCPEGTSEPILCTDGYLCDSSVVSTSQQSQYPCPVGKYCIAGYQYDCEAGYLCISGATTPVPTDGSTGKICDQGTYCALGSSNEGPTVQTDCGVNYYQPNFGATDSTHCIVCAAGTTCLLTANVQPTIIVCPAGYICDSTGNHDCSQGMYCPANSLVEQICPDGTFQDLTT